MVAPSILPGCPEDQATQKNSSAVLCILDLTTLAFFPKYEVALCSQAQVEELNSKTTIVLVSLNCVERSEKGVIKKLST